MKEDRSIAHVSQELYSSEEENLAWQKLWKEMLPAELTGLLRMLEMVVKDYVTLVLSGQSGTRHILLN